MRSKRLRTSQNNSSVVLCSAALPSAPKMIQYGTIAGHDGFLFVFVSRKGYRTDATVSVLLGFLLFLIPARRPFSSSSPSCSNSGRFQWNSKNIFFYLFIYFTSCKSRSKTYQEFPKEAMNYTNKSKKTPKVISFMLCLFFVFCFYFFLTFRRQFKSRPSRPHDHLERFPEADAVGDRDPGRRRIRARGWLQGKTHTSLLMRQHNNMYKLFPNKSCSSACRSAWCFRKKNVFPIGQICICGINKP